jgi:hypothetical protein
MNGRGIRVVAAQALIVGALLLVVYLTLLQPEEQKPLFGVGVPSGPSQVAQAPGGGSSGPARGGAQLGESRGGRGNRGGGHRGMHGDRRASAASTVSGAAAAQAPVLPVPTRDGATGGLTPTGDQYDDTVSRLFGNL